MQQEARVLQADATLLRRCYEDQRAGGSDPAGADHPDLRLDELDHVVDGITRFDMTARRIDVNANVVVTGGGKSHELRADLLRQFLRDAAIDEDRTRLEKIRFRFLADRQFLALVVFVFVHQRLSSVIHACPSDIVRLVT
ncbi:hypothetical protein D3C86_1878080 [compost metagenome]